MFGHTCRAARCHAVTELYYHGAEHVLCDMRHATGLVMLVAKDLHIAARIRRPGYAQSFPNQFTICAQLPSGAETELAKTVNGKGDWLFYGHSDATDTRIEQWWLIELTAFRAGLIGHANNGPRIRCGNKTNPDGSRFKWFDIGSFPDDLPLVVARGKIGT